MGLHGGPIAAGTVQRRMRLVCVGERKRCVLSSIAAAGWQVGGMLRHMKSLRSMQRDNAWIHTLLEVRTLPHPPLMSFYPPVSIWRWTASLNTVHLPDHIDSLCMSVAPAWHLRGLCGWDRRLSLQ